MQGFRRFRAPSRQKSRQAGVELIDGLSLHNGTLRPHRARNKDPNILRIVNNFIIGKTAGSGQI